MTVGGTHRKSKITIAKGIGWERSRVLWYRTVTGLSANAKMIDAATAQVREAAKLGLEDAITVACAWHAVGVLDLDPKIDPHLASIACSTKPAAAPVTAPRPAPPAGPSCEGRASGFVCSDVTPYFAYACLEGTIAGGIACADVTQRCVKASTADWTASVSSDGTLVCR